MASGNSIIVSADPLGKFVQGYVSGTPLPGTIMQVKDDVDPVGGLFTYQAFSRDADGDHPKGAYYVLLEDDLQGYGYDQAYVDGTLCQMYVPLAGDRMNLRVSAAGTGTADAVEIGDILIVNTGDGLLIATTGSPECEPFMVLEDVADVTSTGTLVLCEFTG